MNIPIYLGLTALLSCALAQDYDNHYQIYAPQVVEVQLRKR